MSLTDTIRALEEKYGVTAACTLLDAKTGAVICNYQEDKVYKSASLIKTPIMLHVLEEVEKGRLTLDTEIPLEKHNHTLDEAPLLNDKGTVTIRTLLEYMITYSNNTATNVLIEYFGMDAVNAVIKRLSLPDTILRRRMLDYEAGRQGRENMTSARDMARLYSLIYNQEGLSPFVCETGIDILLRQHDKDYIMAAMPEQKAAHKTGALADISHDAGILYGGNNTVIFAVLSTGENFDICGQFLAEMSSHVKNLL